MPAQTSTRSTRKSSARLRIRQTSRAEYLNKVDPAVRQHFAAATDLPTFLGTAGQLTAAEREVIVQQALILIEQNYAHLPLKRAMHSVDPVQRLKLLLQGLQLGTLTMTDGDFHREVLDIFNSVRDLHTNYVLPAPFTQMVAFLPFLVEDYRENGTRKYVVTRLATGFTHPTFVPGVEIVHWNGVPIERAVWNNGQRYAGSNREARHARGVEILTVRALGLQPPPDELWVVVGYRTLAGTLAELRFDWQVNPSLPGGAEIAESGPASALGIDLEQDIIRRSRLALFVPAVAAAGDGGAKAAALGDLQSTLPKVFMAREVPTQSGTFGYLRIWTFAHWPPAQFVNEFIRLVSALPQNGLIIDVRGNGGGVINNGELVLQTLTPHRIEPEPLQFINTPRNLEICKRNDASSTWTDLTQWAPSIEQSLQTGAVFSAGFPITDPAACNDIGQKYFGPVVLITDALCYSTTDIFAAGFQDHRIGVILGTDGNTGAGGANVWEHRYFTTDILPGSVYQPLPQGAGMRVSIRRTLRVGANAGAPLEDLGVRPDQRHELTRNDVLNGNRDLLEAAGRILRQQQPARALKVTAQGATAATAKLKIQAAGMTRADVYANRRPITSLDLQGNTVDVEVPRSQVVEIQGFDGTDLVARYRTTPQ